MLTAVKNKQKISYIISNQQNHQDPLSFTFDQPLKHGSHRLEKYSNLEDFLEKSLKIIYALKSTEKSCKGLEKSLNSSIFCRN